VAARLVPAQAKLVLKGGELEMRKAILVSAIILAASTGFVFGTTYQPRVIGTGYLSGWSITHDGEEICSDPYVWEGTREIECD
jgi:hypothetical protein